MSQPLSNQPWVLQRLLAFLNSVRQPSDLTESPLIKDDPATGSGYAIGEKVAAQIIRHRASLPRRRYQERAEILAVPGLGKDKLHDLLKSFAVPADTAFLQALRGGILYDNWELSPQTIHFQSLEDMQARLGHLDGLRSEIGQLAAPRHHTGDVAAQRAFRLRCRQAYVTSFTDSHLAAFQFAYWWYTFDQDNWFSFERMRQACETYLSYHSGQQRGMEYVQLQLYNESLRNEITSAEILPAVLNYPERSLTLWWAVLND